MGVLADASAWVMQRSAARSARYGDALRFSGTDLPDPARLKVPTRRGLVTCWVYRPEREPVGAYVHLHGGAFLMRYPQMDDFFCRHVAAECGLVVVNVDYDVAPQKRYPVAQEQAHDVLAWVADHPDGPVRPRASRSGASAPAATWPPPPACKPVTWGRARHACRCWGCPPSTSPRSRRRRPRCWPDR